MDRAGGRVKDVDARQIIASLSASPLRSVDEARMEAPEAPGFYSWWCKPEAVPGKMPAPAHPTEPYRLLYVGIAPNAARLGSNLLKRLRPHTAANIGSSTFRLGLTALLYESEGWTPFLTDRPTLNDVDRAALGDWQREHLRVRWCEVKEPWSNEAAVISGLHPPMNRQHNEGHPFYTSMGVARNALRRSARLGK
jgi:GIY-YIG catalytic domain